jgi:hypothetical protein
MNANHINMTKFSSREDQGYQDVLGELRRMIEALEEEAKSAEPKGEDHSANKYSSVSHVGTVAQGAFVFSGHQNVSGDSHIGKRHLLREGIPSMLMREGNTNHFGSSN